MALINKKSLKREFNKQKNRIGEKVLKKYIQTKEQRLIQEIKQIIRNSKTSGRKTIKQEDFSEEF